MPILIFFLLHWYLSLFSQTFFLHRYAAHGMFTMTRGWERAFYVLTWLTQGSSFLSPKAYGILHRLHHAYTEDDPHSPQFSRNLFAMMWKTKRIYNDVLHDRVPIEAKFKRFVPNWPRWSASAIPGCRASAGVPPTRCFTSPSPRAPGSTCCCQFTTRWGRCTERSSTGFRTNTAT